MTDTLSIDVSEWIDRHRVAPFQAAIVVLCFLIVAIDGFDTASIGFIAPSSARNGGCRPRSSHRCSARAAG